MNRMNRIILLLVLVAGGIALWLSQSKSRQTLEVPADFFQVKDTQEVTRIFMADLNGTSINLKRQGGGWRVNDEHWVDKVSIQNVFEPLVRMRIKSVVSDTDRDFILKEMSVGHIKVEIYRGDALSKTLFIGNATQDGSGTYVFEPESAIDRPYIVHIPGWNGNIGPRFFLDPVDWRSKKVLRAAPERIISVQLDLADSLLDDFSIHRNGKHFGLSVNGVSIDSSRLDKKAMKAYLYRLSTAYFEAFMVEARTGQRDSIRNINPSLAQLKIKTEDDRTVLLRISKRPLDNSSFNPTDSALGYDSDRYNAEKIVDGDTVFARLQIRSAGKLFARPRGFISN